MIVLLILIAICCVVLAGFTGGMVGRAIERHMGSKYRWLAILTVIVMGIAWAVPPFLCWIAAYPN